MFRYRLEVAQLYNIKSIRFDAYDDLTGSINESIMQLRSIIMHHQDIIVDRIQ